MTYKDPALANAQSKRWRSRNAAKAKAIQKKYRSSEQAKATILKYRQTHRHIAHKMTLKRKYGITLDKYNTLLADQKGLCAICELPPDGKGNNGKSLTVDHDHKTGKVRGLLCRSCNWVVGHIENRTKGSLFMLWAYLNKHRR